MIVGGRGVVAGVRVGSVGVVCGMGTVTCVVPPPLLGTGFTPRPNSVIDVPSRSQVGPLSGNGSGGTPSSAASMNALKIVAGT